MKKILILVALCGCGFRPMFADNNTNIFVPVINGINGIELRNALNTKFGGPHGNGAPYTLRVTLKNPITKYKALEPTGDATWQEIYLSANGDKNYHRVYCEKVNDSKYTGYRGAEYVLREFIKYKADQETIDKQFYFYQHDNLYYSRLIR